MRVQRRRIISSAPCRCCPATSSTSCAGCTTLKVFGRSKAQVETIRSVTDRYRRTTMSTLKLAFLSSLVLELLASVSVALVAVSVGLRLLYGHLDLRTSLFVLVLAPEAYLPLRARRRQLPRERRGLERGRPGLRGPRATVPEHGTQSRRPRPGRARDHGRSSHGRVPGPDEPAIDGCSLTIEPGEVVAITGPSGCGKSTLRRRAARLRHAERGAVRVGDVDLADLDPAAWREHIAWVPQRPHLFAGSIAENLRLGRPDATDDELWRAVSRRVARARIARVARSARHDARRAWQRPLRR